LGNQVQYSETMGYVMGEGSSSGSGSASAAFNPVTPEIEYDAEFGVEVIRE